MKTIKSYNNSHPIIYLIATPIGNLKEFSPRAIEIINEMDFLGAEDTRNTNDLLRKFNISKKIISLREHNEVSASEEIIKEVLSGKKFAYMSDAGYPGISDPGSILVKKAIENNIGISVISGSSAFVNALVSSSLPTDHFYFHGFLSAKENEAKEELKLISKKEETLVFYEAPHRIQSTLKNMLEILGNRNISLQRELTKLNEEKIYGTLEELQDLNFSSIKGEIVIVVEGNTNKIEYSDSFIVEKVNFFINKGLSKKDAIDVVSETYGIKKNHIKDITM